MCFSFVHFCISVALSSMESSEQTEVLDALHSIASGNISVEALKVIGDVNMEDNTKLYLKLQPEIQRLRGDPLFTMLECDMEKTMKNTSLEYCFDNSHLSCEVSVFCYILLCIRESVDSLCRDGADTPISP